MRSRFALVALLFSILSVNAAGVDRLDVALVGRSVQKESSVCDQLNAAVEDGVKELSYLEYKGVGDDSAPRDTNRRMWQSVVLNSIQSNILLLQANKCAVPKGPVSLHSYGGNAMECIATEEKLRGSSNRPKVIPACDRSAWSRNKVFVPSENDRLLAIAKLSLGRYFTDPHSASYGKVTLSQRIGDSKRYICGVLNAPSSGGGYTGFLKFYVEMSLDGVVSKVWREGDSTKYKREAGDRGERDAANIANAREKEAASEKCEPSDAVSIVVLQE